MRAVLFGLLMLAAAPVRAQVDPGQGEIIVTASRRDDDDYDERVPAIGLRRTADFAIQTVVVTGDTRDPERRGTEIYALIRGALALAARGGDIELAKGSALVEPLTAANYTDLTLEGDTRPDTQRTTFLIKTRLTAGGDSRAALARVTAFIKAVPPVGRALIEARGDLTLSVVRPDQYRPAIVVLVAAEAGTLAKSFGAGFSVEARGVDRPVEWSRASLTEVLLYVPYQITVVPAR